VCSSDLFDPAAITKEWLQRDMEKRRFKQPVKIHSDFRCDVWQFRRKKYVNGLLELNIPIHSLNFGNVTPTVLELQPWALCADADLSQYAMRCLAQSANALWAGDRVIILAGDYLSEEADIISITENQIAVELTSYLDPNDKNLKAQAVLNREDVSKQFKVGDFVLAMSGEHEGKQGWILSLFEEGTWRERGYKVTEVIVSELGSRLEVHIHCLNVTTLLTLAFRLLV